MMSASLIGRFDLLARQLAGEDRIEALDALCRVAVGDGFDLERMQMAQFWSNDSEVFSTSQTAVAFGIKGLTIGKSLPAPLAKPLKSSWTTAPTANPQAKSTC
jgi:ATP-dependent DNA ligase